MRRALGLLLLVTGCDLTVDAGQRCQATCRGCCTTAGVCDDGTSTLRCGALGSACQACGLGQSCQSGLCAQTNAGGGSAGLDAGVDDAGISDAGFDAGLADAGIGDAGVDAGSTDASVDAGPARSDGGAPWSTSLDCPWWLDAGCAPFSAGPQHLVCDGINGRPTIAALGDDRWAISCLGADTQWEPASVTVVDGLGKVLMRRQLLDGSGYPSDRSDIRLETADGRLQVLTRYTCSDATSLTPSRTFANQCLEFFDLDPTDGGVVASRRFGIPNHNQGPSLVSTGTGLGLAWFNYDTVYFAGLDAQRQWAPAPRVLTSGSNTLRSFLTELVWNGTGYGLFTVHEGQPFRFSRWTAQGQPVQAPVSLGSAGPYSSGRISALFRQGAYFVSYPKGLYGHDLVIEKYSTTGQLLATRTLQSDRYASPTLLERDGRFFVVSADSLRRGIIRAFDAALTPVPALTGLISPGNSAFIEPAAAFDPVTGALGVAAVNNGAIVFQRFASVPTTDAGVVTVCGDGRVDPSERCDLGLGAGTGTCPRSCDDGDPCTTDLLSGLGCQAHCSSTAITTPLNNDRCCAADATPASDSDCVAPRLASPRVLLNQLPEHSSIVPGASEFLVVTSASANDGGITGTLVELDGGVRWQRLLFSGGTRFDHAAAGFDGRFVVAGSEGRLWAPLSSSGSFIGMPAPLDLGPSYGAQDFQYPQLRFGADGRGLLLTISDLATTTVLRQVFSDGGVAKVGRFGSPTGPSRYMRASIAGDGSPWALTHVQPAGLYTTVTPPTDADAMLELISPEALSLRAKTVVADGLGDQVSSSVAAGPGTFLVAICNEGSGRTADVRAFDRVGQPLGAAARLTLGSSIRNTCANVLWTGGDFIATWTEAGRALVGQRFSSRGVRTGPRFIIASDPSEEALGESTGASLDGKVLVLFTQNGELRSVLVE